MCAKISKSTHIFAMFTIEMIGNETGHLLKCIQLYGKLIDMHET